MEYGKKQVPKSVSEYLSTIGKEGGKAGGPERAKKLTPERRREIAAKAGQASGKARRKGVERETTTSEDDWERTVQFHWHRRLGTPPRAVFGAELESQQGALNTAVTVSPYGEGAVVYPSGLISVRLQDAEKLAEWLEAHHWERKQPAPKAENSTP